MLRLLASYANGAGRGGDRLRRLKPGTEVIREYQGVRHTVVITEAGFQWQGQDYSSLTAIARTITGSNWNGPRFFGLREAQEGGADEGSKSGAAGARRAPPAERRAQDG
jgi:hypothetical protein